MAYQRRPQVRSHDAEQRRLTAQSLCGVDPDTAYGCPATRPDLYRSMQLSRRFLFDICGPWPRSVLIDTDSLADYTPHALFNRTHSIATFCVSHKGEVVGRRPGIPHARLEFMRTRHPLKARMAWARFSAHTRASNGSLCLLSRFVVPVKAGQCLPDTPAPLWY